MVILTILPNGDTHHPLSLVLWPHRILCTIRTVVYTRVESVPMVLSPRSLRILMMVYTTVAQRRIGYLDRTDYVSMLSGECIYVETVELIPPYPHDGYG